LAAIRQLAPTASSFSARGGGGIALILNRPIATVKNFLCVDDSLSVQLFVNSFDGFHLLILVNSDGSARDGELDDEDSEEDDHVDEEEDLVVLESGQQTEDSHKEEEDATGDDATQQWQAGDDGSRLPVSRHPNKQERHGHIEDVEAKQCVFRALESRRHGWKVD